MMLDMLFSRINLNLLSIKSHYFFSNAAWSAIVPFIAVYLNQLGISSSTTGILFFILYGSTIFSKAVIGLIADKFKCKRFLFLFFEVLICLTFVAFFFVGDLGAKQNFHFNTSNLSSESLSLVACSENSQSNGQCDDFNFYRQLINLTQVSFQYLCEQDTCSENYSSDIRKMAIKNNGDGGKCLIFQLDTNLTKCPATEANCQLNTNSYFLNNYLLNPFTNQEVVQIPKFWLLSAFLLISWISMAIIVSFADTICFEILDDKPEDYGKQRLWGAIGWGIFGLLTGILIDLFSDPLSVKKNYVAAVVIFIIMSVINVVVSRKLKVHNLSENINMCTNLGNNLCQLKVALFFLWCILIGISTSLVWNFLYWHLESLSNGCQSEVDRNLMKTLEGLVSFVQSFGGELPFFGLSGVILKKIGHVNAMYLVSACFGLRLITYSLITNPWWSVPISFSNGITFGLFHSTMTSYAYSLSSPGTETTMQGLAGAAFEGIGVAFGSLITGELIYAKGTTFTFGIVGFILIGFTVFHFVIQKCFLETKGKKVINKI